MLGDALPAGGLGINQVGFSRDRGPTDVSADSRSPPVSRRHNSYPTSTINRPVHRFDNHDICEAFGGVQGPLGCKGAPTVTRHRYPRSKRKGS
jgi:hypothetical protein